MLLLDRIGPAAHTVMHDFRTQNLSDGPRGRSMTLADDPLWGLAGAVLGGCKDGVSRHHVALLTEAGIDPIPGLIQAPVSIT